MVYYVHCSLRNGKNWLSTPKNNDTLYLWFLFSQLVYSFAVRFFSCISLVYLHIRYHTSFTIYKWAYCNDVRVMLAAAHRVIMFELLHLRYIFLKFGILVSTTAEHPASIIFSKKSVTRCSVIFDFTTFKTVLKIDNANW